MEINMTLKQVIYALILSCCIVLSGCDEKDLSELANNTPLTIKGELSQLGNAPFSNYVITSKKYKKSLPLIIKDIKTKPLIEKKVGHTIKVSGYLLIETKHTNHSDQAAHTYYLVVEDVL